LSDSHAIIDSLKYEDFLLIEKVKSLENELEMSKIELKRFYSNKLNCLLNSQKPHSDKYQTLQNCKVKEKEQRKKKCALQEMKKNFDLLLICLIIKYKRKKVLIHKQ
jgi:hypothetical protein